jgi:hypothetical protein
MGEFREPVTDLRNPETREPGRNTETCEPTHFLRRLGNGWATPPWYFGDGMWRSMNFWLRGGMG